MGRDERSKILASLQLAIERAQAYRDEILDKDREVLHGGATGKTQGHGTYFQQEQQQNNHGYYQDTGYPGNNMNEAKHHQYQRQYQSHNKNNRNENHQQHQHYNDLHNNIRPHFQNHHYHPPLSPGPGTASTFPIYALVDFGITRSQRLRDTDASAATAAAAAIAVASGGSSGGTAFSNNVPMTTSSNSSTIAESTNTSSASTSKETKNRDEEAFHTGAFIHHI
ncbi:hypothetical protein EC991_005622 [Linnemannia zychae]|nr:hypothetical protein EC991_005622 [Linnemannia zychae]